MSSENNTINLPLQVDSPVRFAVIGPGKPYPTILITTERGASELVGYYSLRELGMQNLLEIENERDISFFDLFFRPYRNEKSDESAPIGSVDAWTGTDSPSDRQQLYSLVIQSNAMHKGRLSAPPEVTSGLEAQLRSIASAHRAADVEALRYQAQILTTILGLVDTRASKQIAKRRDFFRVMSYPLMAMFIAAAIAGTVLPIIVAFFEKAKTLSP